MRTSFAMVDLVERAGAGASFPDRGPSRRGRRAAGWSPGGGAGSGDAGAAGCPPDGAASGGAGGSAGACASGCIGSPSGTGASRGAPSDGGTGAGAGLVGEGLRKGTLEGGTEKCSPGRPEPPFSTLSDSSATPEWSLA